MVTLYLTSKVQSKGLQSSVNIANISPMAALGKTRALLDQRHPTSLYLAASRSTLQFH